MFSQRSRVDTLKVCISAEYAEGREGILGAGADEMRHVKTCMGELPEFGTLIV